jgi:putative protein kinase ArgK-like GTPase of G3E family
MTQSAVIENVAETTRRLANRVETLLEKTEFERKLIALAGVPGSGKSTVSQALLVELAARGIHDVAIVPMV